MSNAEQPPAISLFLGDLGAFKLPFVKRAGITTKWQTVNYAGVRVTVYKRAGLYTGWVHVKSEKTDRWEKIVRHTNKALPALGYEIAWLLFDAKRKAAA